MTLIIAHRGASAYAPENTIPAFELAHSQGADMIELDVQITADGVLVVFHDDTTERWGGRRRQVQSCTAAELRALDIGGARAATLAEACGFAWRTGIALNIELKQTGIAAACAAMVREYGIAAQTLFSSFHAAALDDLRRVAPDIPRGYLMGVRSLRPDVRLREAWPFLALKRVQAIAWHPVWEMPLLKCLIPLVRRAGYAVNVWTVDDPAMMRTLAQAGATGIITNTPDVARAISQNKA